MLKNLDFVSEDELTTWVNENLDSNDKALSAGYQGKTLLFQKNNHKLVIKVPLGNFLTRPINLALLRHEYRIYQQLQGLDAVPVCHGMANNEFLVIEFIEGKTMRDYRPSRESGFYESLFEAVQQMHQRGVAHFDLKRKENLLVTANDKPKLIDFGVSVSRKGGWHFLNAYLFKLASQFDYNAWIRHKYDRRYDVIVSEDLPYYNKVWIERLSLRLKKFYKRKIKSLFISN